MWLRALFENRISTRRQNKPTKTSLGRVNYPRQLQLEPLEQRTLLSVGAADERWLTDSAATMIVTTELVGQTVVEDTTSPNTPQMVPLAVRPFQPIPLQDNGQPSRLTAESLVAAPPSYDLRSLGLVTPVKDQGNCGSCWAFATYAALESAILKDGGAVEDFSENHLKNTHGFDWGPCDGGNSLMSQAYLARWSGPIDEADDPYDPASITSPADLPVQAYVRESLVFDTPEEIKNGLMTHGALFTSMYSDPAYYRASDHTYYYSGTASENHAVTIVGWDDTKATAASTPGAWLIKNSWGTGWGDGGYFWISYADTRAAKQAVSFDGAVPPETYERAYYHDEFGPVYAINTPFGFNAFTPVADEAIQSVQFWTLADGASYDVRVYDTFSGGNLSDELARATGTLAFAGAHTIDLPNPVPVAADDPFYVYVNIVNGGSSPLGLDGWIDGYTSAAAAAPGQSYYSFDGTSWSDLWSFNNTANLSIKALTVKAAEYDFGDAPDPDYPTLLASDGARHLLGGGLLLGASADGEDEGQPNSTATGDDDANGDDEDGVTFSESLIVGTEATIAVTASAPGKLDAWIDFNRDGAWQPGEKVADSVAVVAGTNQLSVSVPLDASLGETFARFRLSTAGGLAPTGEAADGEVEDYHVTIEPRLDVVVTANDAGGNGVGNGTPDTFRLVRNGATIEVYLDGNLSATYPADAVDSITIAGSADEDTLIIDNSGGLVAPREQIAFDGEALGANTGTGDRLILEGNPGSPIAVEAYVAGPAVPSSLGGPLGPDGGILVLDPDGSTGIGANPDGLNHDEQIVFFRGLAPIYDTTPVGQLNILTGPGAETIDVTDGAGIAGAATMLVAERGGGFESIELANKSVVTISTLDGADTVAIDHPKAAAGLTALAVYGNELTGGGLETDDNAADQVFVQAIGAAVAIYGQGGDDAFTVAPARSTQISIHGDLPAQPASPGDSLDLDIPQDATSPPVFTGDAADGRMALGGYQDVSWNGIETLMAGPADWGDAPDPSYPTRFSGSSILETTAAVHFLYPGRRLGASVDAEDDGQPNSTATGDDANGDDEDGVVFPSTLVAGTQATIAVTATGAGKLDAWIDFNRDGIWDAGERIANSVALDNETVNLVIDVPAGAAVGETFARFRFSSAGALAPTGVAADGEVEDYCITIDPSTVAHDYGDAPDPSYPTFLASDGARHLLGSDLFLGAGVDGESDGLPSAYATGDDEDDGVVFRSALHRGSTAYVDITVSQPALLNAWIDFDGNGSWAEAGEQIFSAMPLAAGTNTLSFFVPAGAAVTSQTFARFRVSTDGNLSFTGPAPDGEVEDYALAIADFNRDPVISASDPGGNGLNNGQADDVLLVRNGANLEVYFTDGGVRRFSRAFDFASLNSITFLGSDDSDSLSVDFSGGDVVPGGGVDFQGAGETTGPGDALSLLAGTFDSVAHYLDAPGRGSVELDGPGDRITYTGLEPISDLIVANTRTLVYGSGDDTDVRLFDPDTADATVRIEAPANAESVDLNTTGMNRLVVSLGAGNDTMEIERLGSGFAATIEVNGDADNDTLVVDFSQGLVEETIEFAGGSSPAGDVDRLVLTGDPGVGIARETYLVGATEDAGAWIVDPNGSDGPGAPGTGRDGDELVVQFSGLEPVDTDLPAAVFDTILSAVGDWIVIGDGGSLNGAAALQVSDNLGTFETFRFANKATARLMGQSGGDVFQLGFSTASAGLGALELYGHVAAGVAGQPADDDLGETFALVQTAAGIETILVGDGGSDLFVHDLAVGGNLSGLQGTIRVTGGSGTEDLVALQDANAAGPRTATLTATELTGAAPATFHYTEIETLLYEASRGDDTIHIRSTAAGTRYGISGDGGSDQINITSATGTLDEILGPITLLADLSGTPGDADALLLDDSGSAALAGTASIDNVGALTFATATAGSPLLPAAVSFAGDATRLRGFAPAEIRYFHDTVAGVPARLETLTVRTSAGDDTVHVNDTTAAEATVVHGLGGADTFFLRGDYLSATNRFLGHDGNDRFVLEIGSDLGAGSVFPIATVEVDGGAPAGSDADSAKRDRVEINDASGAARTMAFDYAEMAGGLDIVGGFAVDVNLRAAETVHYAGSGAADTITVRGTSADDEITVAPIDLDTALVFLGGNPWDGPNDPSAFAGALPGVAGASAGPDLRLDNLAPATGLWIDGEDAAADDGDRLYVYARSETALVDGTAADHFGFGPGVLLPGAGAGLSNDEIFVTDAAVRMVDDLAAASPADVRVRVNLVTSSFTQAAADVPGLVVNTGSEAAPGVDGVADDIVAELSFRLAIQVNGGDPLPALAPSGDRLGLTAPGEINVFSDKSIPSEVTITSSDPASGRPSFELKWSSIEQIVLTPGSASQTVNLVGDNNDPAVDQSDNFVVVGADVDALLPAIPGAQPGFQPDADGDHEFFLQINGSAPIAFRNVTQVNVFGDDQNPPPGTPSAGPNDVDRLEVTPYADNTPGGWGVDVSFDEGNPGADALDSPDLLVYNAVPGVSEELIVVPSGPGTGQLLVRNAADGSLIAAIDYTTNTGIVLHGNDGSAGDTDRLILAGTDGTTASASGHDAVVADFTASGTAAEPVISVADTLSGDVLYQLINYTNFDRITFDLLDGDDAITIRGRTNDAAIDMDAVTVLAGSGDDLLTLDNRAGLIDLAAGLVYDGGLGRDALRLEGDTAVETAEYTVGPNPGDGTLVHRLGAAVQRVAFTGLEPVVDTVAAATLTVNATDASNAIGYTQSAQDASRGRVAIDGFEAIEFSGKASLVINALGGDDVISLENPLAPVGLTAIAVHGGGPASGDRLIYTKPADSQFSSIALNPAAAGTGTLTDSTGQLVPVTYATVEAIEVVLAFHNGDTFLINGTAGDDHFRVASGPEAGRTQIEGTMDRNGQVFALPSIEVHNDSGLTAGAYNFLGAGGTDTYTLAGTNVDDQFTLTRFSPTLAGVRHFVGGVATNYLAFDNMSTAIFEGLDGDDTFNVPAGLAFTVEVHGGDPAASDVLNYLSAGTASIAVDLANRTIAEGSSSPVRFSAIEQVNLEADGMDVAVRGTPGDDAIRYAPRASDRGELALAGLNTLLAVGHVNRLSVDGLAGSDALTVHASSNADTIDASGTSVAVHDGTVARKTLDYSGFESLAVHGLAGDDTFRVLPAALPIFVDGGDPIGTTPGDRLHLLAGPALFEPGPETDEGAFLVAGSQRVSFDRIEGIDFGGGGPVVIVGTDGDDDITVIARDSSTHAGADGVQDFTVSVNDRLEWLLLDVDTLYIDGRAGDDDIVVRAPAPNQADWDVDVTVVGGTPAASDTLVLETPGKTAVDYRPTGDDTGEVTIRGAVHDSRLYLSDGFALAALGYTSSPGGIDHFVYDGQNGGDDLQVLLDDALSDVATYALDPITSSGSVEITSGGGPRLGIHFQSVSDAGDLGSLAIRDGGTAAGIDDYVVYRGTLTGDGIYVSSAGTITNFAPLFPPLHTAGIEILGVEADEADDVVTIDANTPFSTFLLSGGNPDASDTLHFTASGAGDVVIDVANGAIVEPGRTVRFLGFEHVHLEASGADVRFQGTTGDDTIRYAPTGAEAGELALEGINTRFALSGVGDLAVDASDGADALTVLGNERANTIDVLRGPTASVVVSDQSPALVLQAVALLNAEALNVSGGAGADLIRVAGTGGPALRADGGDPIGTTPGDQLHIAAGSGAVLYQPGPETDEGSLVFEGSDPVSFDRIEGLSLLGGGPVVIAGTEGADEITVIARDSSTHAGADGAQDFTVSINGGPEALFLDVDTLYLDGRAGDDHIVVRAPAPNLADWDVDVTVVGGTPAASDTLVLETLGSTTALFAPTGPDTGEVTIRGTVDDSRLAMVASFSLPALGYVSSSGGIEQFVYDGQGGADALTVVTPAGSQTIAYTPGPVTDAASLQVDSLLPMRFVHLGAGSVSLANTGGAREDTLIYHGTAADDLFTLDGAGDGSVLLNAQRLVTTPGVNAVVLEGLAGNDTFAVAGSHPFADGIRVSGGDADLDVLEFLGVGVGDILLDLANRTVAKAGSAPVAFASTELVDLNAAAVNVVVMATGGDDLLDYTPTDANGGQLALAGLDSLFRLSNVDNLVYAGQGGTDTVTVHGSDAAENIDVVRGADPTVTVDALQPLRMTAVEAVAVVAGLGDDWIDVSGSGGPTLVLDGGLPSTEGDTPAPGDVVHLANATAGQTRVIPGAALDAGTIITPDGTVLFAGVEGVHLLGAAGDDTLQVEGTGAADMIALGLEDGVNAAQVNARTSVTFAAIETVEVFGLSGDDAFDLRPADLVGVGAIRVRGGDPAASDTLLIHGTLGSDAIDVTPTAADAGLVSVNGIQVGFETTELLHIQGLGGDDVMSVTDSSTADVITYTPGAVIDAGSLRVGTLVPMRFEDLGANGALYLTDFVGTNDTLVYEGTAGNDRFAVAGQMIDLTTEDVNDHIPVMFLGMERLVLSGLGGSDEAALQGSTLSDNIEVSLAATGDQVTGANLAAVSLLAIEQLAVEGSTGDDAFLLNNLGGETDLETVVFDSGGESGDSVRLIGSGPQETITVTPQSSTTVTASSSGAATLLHAILGDVAASTFTVDLADVDDLVVNATSAADAPILVNGSEVAVPGRKAVGYENGRRLTVRGLGGSDRFDVTPSADIEIFLDGGDPIGVTPGDYVNVVAGGSAVAFEAGPEADEGAVIVEGRQRVSFDHIEALSLSGPGPVLVLGTNADDDLTVIARDGSTHAGADGVQDLTFSVNDGPEVLLIDVAALYIDAMAGDDDIVLRTPAPNRADWNVEVTVAGGTPSDSDRLVLETPGDDELVEYQPAGYVPPAAFAHGDADTGRIAIRELSGNDSLINLGPFVLGSFAEGWMSSPGGVEHLVYDGENGNDSLRVLLDGLLSETVSYAYDPATGNGTIQVVAEGAPRLPIEFQNIANPSTVLGQVTLSDGLGQSLDTLVYYGTGGQDALTLWGGTLDVENAAVPIPLNVEGIENLVLEGLEGDDVFTIYDNHPYVSIKVAGGGPEASDVLYLNGNAAAQAIDLFLETDRIGGFGGWIDADGVEKVVLDGAGGGDTLTVYGTIDDDRITYTPTGSEEGTVKRENSVTEYAFRQIGGTFRVDGSSDVADALVVVGTNSHDVFTIDTRQAVRTVTVENAAGTVLKPVVLHESVETVTALGRLGNDTFLVVPDEHVGDLAIGQLPYNLLVHVDGGSPGASDALVVAGNELGDPLAANELVVVNRSRTADEGVVRVFRNAVALPDISYAGVEVVSPVPSLSGAGDPNLLILGPDVYEQNEYHTTAAYLGSGEVINVTDLAIFPGWGEHRFVVADEDYFRVVAKHTGVMDFQVYFHGYDPGLLPEGGNLDLRVLDSDGTEIAGNGPFGANEADPLDADERVRIPVVAGQTYYLHVSGLGEAASVVANGYDLTITNTPAPVPYGLELQDTPIGDNSDTGRSQLDNVTFDNTPTLYFRLDDAFLLNDLPGNPLADAPPDQPIPIPFQEIALASGYRIAIFDEGSTPDQAAMPPQTPLGYAVATGEPGVYRFTVPADLALADGSHFLTARVEMIDPATPTQTGFGPRSAALEIVVDTQRPVPFFGEMANPFDGLHADSDTGIVDQPNTRVDVITHDSTPTFWGTAEADTILRLYADLNGNGLLDPADDLYLGQTMAVPLDGSNQFPGGHWTFTTPIDLNDPAYFETDGLRTIFVTAEDVAGNATMPGTAPRLHVFLDTRGPRVAAVTFAGGMSVFDPKPYVGPTPLSESIDITFLDDPARTPMFDYAAVNAALATTPGNYQLVGDANGAILIDRVEIIADANVDVGGLSKRMTTVRLFFAEPLPDDRFTLTVFDRIADQPGNALDGDVQATGPGTEEGLLPSGDGVPGESFVGRFTVDTRPELGVWGGGSVWVDINGNFTFDPQNPDHTNRDITYRFGITSDNVFVGNFNRFAHGVADGFDKLAAYGRLENQYRWLIDTDNDGVADVNQVEPSQINGLPIAGRFDGNPFNGDEVGLVVASLTEPGSLWYFDTDHDFLINADQVLVSQLQGFPVVGDFNGDGLDDLATWQEDRFQIDLADPAGIGGLPWDGVADATFSFGFIGVRERPVAADLNADGFEDLGLWVPDRSGATPGELSEWYFLLSGPLAEGSPAVSILDRPDVLAGTAEFKPVPFGHDRTAQFGDEFAAPLVGNLDPPVVDAPKVLRLMGTDGDDTFTFAAGPAPGSWTVVVNAETIVVPSGIAAIEFDGLGGADTVVLTGTDDADSIELWPDRAELIGNGYTVRVAGAETITADGLLGDDRAVLHDSSGDEWFITNPFVTTMTGDALDWTLHGFETVAADANAGGTDVALLYGTAKDETFIASPDSATMAGSWFSLTADSFDYVHGMAGPGNDVAELHDSPGDEIFVGRKRYSAMTGDGFYIRAWRFDAVHAYATAGGHDYARLEGTFWDETLVVSPEQTDMRNARFSYTVNQFEAVHATGFGGTDVAHFYDTPGDDLFQATPQYAKLTGDTFASMAVAFAYVHAYATAGGADAAILHDSSGNDTFVGRPAESKLFGEKFFVRAKAFDWVHGVASNGGRDVAYFFGSHTDDELLAGRDFIRLFGDGFFYQTKYFDEVHALGRGGSDASEVRSATLQRGTAAADPLAGAIKQVLWMYEFEEVQVKDDPEEGDSSTVAAVDEIFRAFWA